ncbi:MAG: hypothetical protein C5B50_00190 [Verrucomicrobia bacterium]|nr:MAG: hypothetical protein C5B50_00190 [Verrucomicrobiota bacterium]
MSWDLFALNFPAEIRDLSQLPETFKETPIGRTAEIANTIMEVQGARVSGEGLLTIERQGYAIEISIGPEAVCKWIMFYVYGDGAAAAEVIQSVGKRLGVRIWDINGSQFLDSAADPTLGFRAYKAYRDKVLKDSGADGTS